MASTAADTQQPLPQLLQGIDRVPGLRQAIMLLALAGSIALGVTTVLWMRTPAHTALPPMPKMGEAQQMLMTAGIEVNDKGDRLTVPHSDYARAKTMLIEGNLLSAEHRNCTDIPGSSSMTRSLQVEREALNCHREVELARTINNLRGVTGAAVHISDPKTGPFIRPRVDTTASVTVSLAPGREADRELARSIVHLVADSVPMLMPENVTVVADGRMISDQVNGGGSMDLSNEQMQFQRMLETQKQDKIRAILDRPLGGPEHYTVTVSAEIDFTRIDRTSRRPTEAVVIGSTEQVTESPFGQTQPSGVPGALVNTPIPTNDDVEAQGDGGATGGVPANDSRNLSRTSTVNSETGEIFERVTQPQGTLQRLTVSVMLNEFAPRAEVAAPTDSAEGAAAPTPTEGEGDDAAAAPEARFSPEDLARLEALIRDAVAFNAERGDRLTIESMPFQPIVYEEPTPAPWWQSPLVIDLSRQALGALFVAAIFFTTVRPMIGKLMTAPTHVALPAGAYGQPALGNDGAPGAQAAAEDPAVIEADREARFAEVRNLAAKDPDRTAGIIQGWMQD